MTKDLVLKVGSSIAEKHNVKCFSYDINDKAEEVLFYFSDGDKLLTTKVKYNKINSYLN